MCIKSEWEELCIYSVLHAGDASTSLTERALELTAWVHPPHPTSQASADVRPPVFRTCRHAAAADTGSVDHPPVVPASSPSSASSGGIALKRPSAWSGAKLGTVGAPLAAWLTSAPGPAPDGTHVQLSAGATALYTLRRVNRRLCTQES